MRMLDEHWRRRYRALCREVWGSTGLERRKPQGGRLMKRWHAIERRAVDQMPIFGFTEIDWWAEHSNQFIVDVVATDRLGRRCLLDVTCRLQARFLEKSRLAISLRMPLYIMFASPIHEMYVVREVPSGQVTMRLPMAIIRAELPNALLRKKVVA